MRLNVPGSKNQRLFLSMLVIALLVFATGCSMDPNTRTANKISRELVRSFGDDARTVTVTFSEGTVTLSGNVTDRATQELAEEVARSAEGVANVQNDIEGPEQGVLANIKNEAADALLEMSVDSSLSRKVGSDFAHAIEVEVVDATVALRGIVPDRKRRQLAVDSAGAVDGVERVIDLLEVRKP